MNSIIGKTVQLYTVDPEAGEVGIAFTDGTIIAIKGGEVVYVNLLLKQALHVIGEAA